jgi:predicted ester cyclase
MPKIADAAVEANVSRIVEEMLAALNAHDADKVVSLVTTEYNGMDATQALPQKDRGGARMALEIYFEALPDFRMVEHELLIDGDRAAIMWRARGTHLGRIMHIQPTGKEVEVCGTTVLHLKGTRICKAVSVWDVAAMLREIGLLTEL